jgi:Kef-type K+ transport system membrane component KefB
VVGRIPGFTDAIFPTTSLPVLNNVANLGLILFLFIIGLEVDLRVFFSNWKMALSVAGAGMTFPFALGCAIAHGLYYEFLNEEGLVPIAYGTFVRFVGYKPDFGHFLTLYLVLLSCYSLGLLCLSQ